MRKRYGIWIEHVFVKCSVDIPLGLQMGSIETSSFQ